LKGSKNNELGYERVSVVLMIIFLKKNELGILNQKSKNTLDMFFKIGGLPESGRYFFQKRRVLYYIIRNKKAFIASFRIRRLQRKDAVI
jgi:hypothetical protein